MLVPSAGLLMSFLSHIAGPLIALPSPAPGVTITVRDNHDQVKAGQIVRSDVIVHNAGQAEAPVTVKLTMPARTITRLDAPDADLFANAAAWQNVASASETRTYTLAGQIDRAAHLRSLDGTACVHNQPNAPAVACATERDPLAAMQKDDPGTRRIAWIGAIVFGILAAIGAIWLYRKVDPELLTPATANKAAQPGGAPSD